MVPGLRDMSPSIRFAIRRVLAILDICMTRARCGRGARRFGIMQMGDITGVPIRSISEVVDGSCRGFGHSRRIRLGAGSCYVRLIC
jgi:hypothetical protein